MTPTQYVLITHQPGAIGAAADNAYSTPGTSEADLRGAGELLAGGASPPMTFAVLALQPAQWDSA
jgi:hypothetical protein